MSKTAIIEAIKSKVGRIVDDNSRLRVELEKTVRQRDRLRGENRELAEQVARLEKRIGILELRGSMVGDSEGKKEARARVNRLMREVDKCIALLNK